MSKQAVLLIAHGSPDNVQDIPAFLQNISRGRPMSDAVVQEVQHRYSQIGISPLTCLTLGQTNGVARELGIPAYMGMRNWHPFIADTLKQMTADRRPAGRRHLPGATQFAYQRWTVQAGIIRRGRALCYRFCRRVARSSAIDRSFC